MVCGRGVTIDTVGSTFDTTLAVYRGSPLSALTAVVSDDDGGGNLTSKVTFGAVAGTAYQIAVDGYSGASGTITLHLNLSASGAITPTGWFYPLNQSVTSSGNWLAHGATYLTGKAHIGTDLAASAETPVYAIGAGTVIARQGPGAGWGDGNYALAILHHSTAGDYVAVYGHIRTSLTVGARVSAGDQIATIGSCLEGGVRFSYDHLHFGIRPGSIAPPVNTSVQGHEYGWGRVAEVDFLNNGFTNGFVDPINWINARFPAG